MAKKTSDLSVHRRCFHDCVRVTTTKHGNFTRYKFQLGRVPLRFNQRERNRGGGEREGAVRNIFTHAFFSTFLYFFIIFFSHSLSLSLTLFYITLVRAANRSKTAQRGVKTNQFFSFQRKRLTLLYSKIILFMYKG